MPSSDIVVVGASAGGVEALKTLVARLPGDLKAAVFVTLHIGARSSQLPEILSRAGPLEANQATDGEQVQSGRIYVAPPDHHLLLEMGRVSLSHGPKENHTRPAINPSFRSAARAYKERVTGVILTGSLDDGVAGLAEIKRCGGIAIVQDPNTATHPSMPQSAIKHVDIDHILPVDAIAVLIARLALTECIGMAKQESIERKLVEMTCPECQGPIWEERQGKIVEYRCRVGHAFAPLAMLDGFQETVEDTLWRAVVSLEAAADVAGHLGSELGPKASAIAQKQRRQAASIREMLDNTLS